MKEIVKLPWTYLICRLIKSLFDSITNLYNICQTKPTTNSENNNQRRFFTYTANLSEMDSFVGGWGNDLNSEQRHFRVLAREPFIQINEYLQAQRTLGTVSHSQSLAVTTMSDPNGANEVSQTDRIVMGRRMISGFVRRSNGNQWWVESTWESVDIFNLDEILHSGEYEWHPLNYIGDPNFVKIAMIQDDNIVLFRNIVDWSRSDGDVLSQQIVWSGNFENCRRILQVLQENSDTCNSLTLLRESFHLHPELRAQYIMLHSIHPLVATIAAVNSCRNVYISQELQDTRDGDSDRLLCAICHEVLSTGEPATELRCNHIFHLRCISHWFLRRLSCPLCRDELT